MNIIQINANKIVTVIVFSATTFVSCKKKEPEISKTNPIKTDVAYTKVDMSTLKGYMSKLINVEAKDVVYNEKTEYFSIFGIDQISKEELTKFYLISKNN